jgi:carboxymethylenebutenolidase
MRRFAIVVFVSIALLACAGRSVAPAEHQHSAPATVLPVALHGKNVSFPAAVGSADGYLSLPKGEGKHPAIVVIHEWWGLDDWIQQNTDRFADQGYVAFAVDLYRGKVTQDPSVAHELMRGLPEDRAISDLKAAFAYLATLPEVDPSRIASVGWCMGGGYSLALATNEPRLRACVVNYGRLVTDPVTVSKISASLLGNFAGKDQGIPPADVVAFQKMLDAQKKPNDIKIYPNDGHAFMNPSNRAGYDAAAAADAWKRIDMFLAAELKR